MATIDPEERRRRILERQKERMALIQGTSVENVTMPEEYHKYEAEQRMKEQPPEQTDMLPAGLVGKSGSLLGQLWLIKDKPFRKFLTKMDIILIPLELLILFLNTQYTSIPDLYAILAVSLLLIPVKHLILSQWLKGKGGKYDTKLSVYTTIYCSLLSLILRAILSVTFVVVVRKVKDTV